jgi:hypothetical protein
VEAGVRTVNLSKRSVVVFVAALLFVVAGLVVSATQRESTQGERLRSPTSSVPASVAVLPGLAAAGVAAVAINAANRRERERLHEEARREIARQNHERDLKQAELEDRRQSRLRDERLEAYLAYMAVCDRVHGGDHSQEARAELRKIVEVVELVSLSKEVQDSVRVLTNHLIIRTAKGETETVSLRDESAYRALLGRFKKAIQRDLGITPATTQDPA